MNEWDDADPRRRSLPRPLREILNPALERMATSEQARAFAAWARASGAPVASAARPGAFFNGVLTVECASSIWANELTYFHSQILTRMNEIMPENPVKRLRFVVARYAPPPEATDTTPAGSDRDREPLSSEELAEARMAAEGIRDGRLREAIEAVLRASGSER